MISKLKQQELKDRFLEACKYGNLETVREMVFFDKSLVNIVHRDYTGLMLSVVKPIYVYFYPPVANNLFIFENGEFHPKEDHGGFEYGKDLEGKLYVKCKRARSKYNGCIDWPDNDNFELVKFLVEMGLTLIIQMRQGLVF